jgi:DNA polymerase-3 subunit chi
VTEILFYHLEARPLEKVLPVLLERSLSRGWRVVVEVGAPERARLIDELLWTFRDDSFLPHALAGGEFDADQPVLIATGPENPNGAHVRFYVDRALPPSGEGQSGGDYERIVILFSGHDPEAVAEARGAWKALGPGNTLTYWQQDAEGRWQKRG